jgi:hypothetical protein
MIVPPATPSLPLPPARPRSRAPRLLIQLAGFLIGLGLLGWCVAMALKPANRQSLNDLFHASATQISTLVGLSVATLFLNGLIFWITLLPVRRLRLADVLATSALATFLLYLPFKLSVVARAVIHNRRDHMPLLTIGAWLVALGIVVMATLCPMLLASIWRGRIDPPWFAAAGIGLLLVFATLVGTSRAFAGEAGLARLHRLADPLPLPPLQRFLRSGIFVRFHQGFTMLASPATVGAAMLLRILDIGVQAIRFMVAAEVVGQHLTPDQAFLIASTYFLIGATSPAGSLGMREAGTTGLAGLLHLGGTNFTVVALVVSAAELVVNLTGAAAAVAWLRPDRLILGRPTPPA